MDTNGTLMAKMRRPMPEPDPRNVGLGANGRLSPEITEEISRSIVQDEKASSDVIKMFLKLGVDLRYEAVSASLMGGKVGAPTNGVDLAAAFKQGADETEKMNVGPNIVLRSRLFAIVGKNLDEVLTPDDLDTLRQLASRVTVPHNEGKFGGKPKPLEQIVTDMEALAAKESGEQSPALEPEENTVLQ